MESESRTGDVMGPRRVRFPVLILFWATIAFGFTLVQVRQSLHDGRLSAPPTYDDIGYFGDAQTRLHVVRSQGPMAALRDAFENPPHSPWSTGLATLAFLFLGMQEWAPAAANGIIILGLLIFLSLRARGLPMAWQLPIAVFLLTWPLVGQSVVNFRPDIAFGLVAAWTGLQISSRPWLTAGRRHHYLAGAGLGLALLIKPTVGPLAAVIAITALTAATLTDWACGHPWRSWRPVVGSWCRCLGLAALIAAPYYAVAYRRIFDYLYRNNFGELRELWKLDLKTSEHALYYLTGVGGRFLLDAWLYLWIGLAVTALVLTLARRDTASLARIPATAAVFLTTYALITLPAHKNQFLGAVLPCLLLLSAMEMLIHIACASRTAAAARSRAAGALLLSSLALAGLALFDWPARFAPWRPPPPDVVRQHRELLEEVYGELLSSGKEPARVLFTHIGQYFNPQLLRYRSNLDRIRRINALDLASSTDPAALETELSVATDVIVFSPDNPSSLPWLPAAGIQQRVLDRLAEHPRFVLGSTHATPGGGELFLFERARGFSGIRTMENLGPVEGPYPDLGLPFPVLWGLGPMSRFAIEVPPAGAMRLIVEGASSLPDQTMTVHLAGRVVGEHRFTSLNEFERMALTLELPPGEQVLEIHYTRWHEPSERDARPLAVLFRTLVAAATHRTP